MTRITINDTLQSDLRNTEGEAELVDQLGHRIGYFLNDEFFRRLACRWANLNVRDEELEQA